MVLARRAGTAADFLGEASPLAYLSLHIIRDDFGGFVFPEPHWRLDR
jgi:hypothetical protein